MAKSLIGNVAAAVGAGITAMGAHSARAAAQANAVSRQAQAAQGAFNQNSANIANSIGDNRIASQYGFNSGMMANANDYNTAMWEKTAAWNENMWERQAEYNAEQAQIQRNWAERMDNTRYQRAIKDMESAGLNPILAVTGGGIQTGGISGSAASVGGAQMSSAQSAMTSGGLLGANQASEGNYTGQMEYMGGMLGLLGAAISGISTAFKAMGNMGDFGEGLAKGIGQLFNPKELFKANENSIMAWKDPYKNFLNKDFKSSNKHWEYELEQKPRSKYKFLP